MKTRNKIIFFISAIILTLAAFVWISGQIIDNNISEAENDILDQRIQIKYFYDRGCSVCAQMELFLNDLEVEFSETINIRRYSFFKHIQFLTGLYQKYNVPRRKWGTVPITFIQDRYFSGFDPEVGQEIRKYILELKEI